MPEDSFDAALVAVRQVSEKLKSLSNDLEKVKSEIDTREKEVQSHRAAPLPESDLGAFLLEYVDTTAAQGEKALAAHLNDIMYQHRPGMPVQTHEVRPLTFAEVGEVLGNESLDSAGWLCDNLPLPLPYLNADGDCFQGRRILTFLFKAQIKEGIATLAQNGRLSYRRKESSGLPLATRRARLEELETELAALRTEKAGIESSISALKGGLK
jgi:hypothetical protein